MFRLISNGVCRAALIVVASGADVDLVTAQSRESVSVARIAPRPDDVATMDGIVKAFYEVVSGPAGQPRDWTRDRTLYVEGVRLVGTGQRNGRPFVNVMNHREYVDSSDQDFVRNGFFETEIHRVVRRFGNLAHVFSTYETRRTVDGPLIARGLTSIELVNDGDRWWIAAVVWDSERPDSPVPPEFLPKHQRGRP